MITTSTMARLYTRSDGGPTRSRSEIDPEQELLVVAIGRVFLPWAERSAAIGQDHPLRRLVLEVCRELDIVEADLSRFVEHQAERCRRIAALPFPRHDGIADMTEAVVRQRRCSPLPAQADAAAEFTVPDPEQPAR